MAGGTGHRSVSSLERIGGLLMILDLELGGKKPIHGVAGFPSAAASGGEFNQLSLVSVPVTNTPGLKAQPAKFCGPARERGGATLAGDVFVAAPVGEFGL